MTREYYSGQATMIIYPAKYVLLGKKLQIVRWTSVIFGVAECNELFCSLSRLSLANATRPPGKVPVCL